MAKRPKRRASAGKAGKQIVPASTDCYVTIRALDDGKSLSAVLSDAADLQRLVRRWRYILRMRSRWVDDPDLCEDFGKRAHEDLVAAGVPADFLKQLTTVKHVEVEIHAWDVADPAINAIHENASAIPWEYLISAATSTVGRFHSFLITRLLRNQSKAPPKPAVKDVLFLEGAPGRLDGLYDFDAERSRISAAIGGSEDKLTVLETPPLSALRGEARKRPWQAVHVTGIDTQQATYLLKEDEESDFWAPYLDNGRVPDGMMLREVDKAELPVPYRDLAAALVNEAQPPLIVTLNLHYSGARTAREMVRQGAHAALGFLDEIDDELAELFFQAFYTAWAAQPGDIPAALTAAWQAMPSDSLYGTSIVIWMGHSEQERFRSSLTKEEAPPATVGSRTSWLDRHARLPIDGLLQVEFNIDSEINYSLLHNDRPLISALTLTKLVKEPLEDIAVLVELNVGAQTYPFRHTVPVFNDVQLALASEVKIPLTAALPRSLRERVHSTAYVRVTVGGRTAHEETRRVTLIPVDEWLDDTDKNPWLPSFVLPRDPAITKIMGSARRYLIGIADDPGAGFDGYQSVDEEAEDPTQGVDNQVRAIWTTLVNDYRLQYINPPPAYSGRTQRLRMPSEIVATNSGTCVDLALLLASCLEYIDVYPVVVLLTGHAFVGYWRSEDAHVEFAGIERIPPTIPLVGSREAREGTTPYVDPYGWRLTVRSYHEIMDYVSSGDLVLLEATFLTRSSSFDEAIQEGRANMRSRREFDSLLDIQLARAAAVPVTPLPVINE
jgi:hypothetical protein